MYGVAFSSLWHDNDHMNQPSTLSLPSGATLAYHACAGNAPTVVFLGGFRSDMSGTKALALDAHCRATGQAFLRFDYEGHGQSSGRFEDGSIGLWISNVIAMLTACTNGPLILVGSSMGGWIMLHAALALKERVVGLIGIAAAPDFPERLIWQQLSNSQQQLLKEQGSLTLPCDYGSEPYSISYHFIEESRQHRLLDHTIALTCHVHLLHGMADHDVPWHFSTTLATQLKSQDVEVSLVKNGDHRMSSPDQIAALLRIVDRMIEKTR